MSVLSFKLYCLLKGLIVCVQILLQFITSGVLKVLRYLHANQKSNDDDDDIAKGTTSLAPCLHP